MIWSVCLHELKTSEGKVYESKYQALKDYGCDELELDKVTENVLFSKLRYNQLRALIDSNIMIKLDY